MSKLFALIFVSILLFGVSMTQAAPPQQSNLEEDVFTITCDTGEEIIGGVIFTFLNVNPGFTYRVTAIGIDGFDPVLAVVTEPGVGACNDDEPRAIGSQVAVPGVGLVEATNLTAQVQVNTARGGNIDVVVGGFQGVTGKFAMVIEGLAIEPADELDGFLISVPEVIQDEPIGVYMISRFAQLDAYMELYGGPGLQTPVLDFNQVEFIASCDDVGVGDCTNTPQFPGGGTDIANGYRYEAAALDAGLNYSLGSTDKFLYVFGSSSSRSRGDYGIIVIGTVPGSLERDATTTSGLGATGCNNVASTIIDVTSEFDARFTADNLLDNDPTTGWASDGKEDTSAIIIGLNGTRLIDEIRFNSYPTDPQYVNDAIKDFVVATLTSKGEIDQMLVQATAAQQSGYQAYTFNPVETNQIGIVFLSNYGGDYFEASDILVCAR